MSGASSRSGPLGPLSGEYSSDSPDNTFELGEQLAGTLMAGDLVLLTGGLGAGKTLFTKGVLNGLGFDVDEVTSPSFALVNLYRTARFDVYHIDLWRIGEHNDPAGSVGLEDILAEPDTITIIEWADHLGDTRYSNRSIKIGFSGDGDESRNISISIPEDGPPKI